MEGFWWLGTTFGVILFAYLSCLRQNSAAGQVGEAFCKGGVPSMKVSVDWVQVLCEVGCRKVNFEEIWCRKNVELYKSTKYVKILRLTAVVLRNYAPQIVFWCKLVPPRSEMRTKCGPMAGKATPRAPKGAIMNREGSKRTPKGSQSKPKGWYVEPKGCQKGAKGAPRMHPKIHVRKRS